MPKAWAPYNNKKEVDCIWTSWFNIRRLWKSLSHEFANILWNKILEFLAWNGEIWLVSIGYSNLDFFVRVQICRRSSRFRVLLQFNVTIIIFDDRRGGDRLNENIYLFIGSHHYRIYARHCHVIRWPCDLITWIHVICMWNIFEMNIIGKKIGSINFSRK